MLKLLRVSTRPEKGQATIEYVLLLVVLVFAHIVIVRAGFVSLAVDVGSSLVEVIQS